jgi:hypothetical protein
MTEPSDGIISALRQSILVRWLERRNKDETISLILISVQISLGCLGAYILGVALSFPWVIVRLFNHETILHLTSGFFLLAVIWWACFKLSRLLILGLCVFWIFLIAKFRVGPKFKRGVHSRQASRFQSLKLRRILSKDVKLFLVAQLAISTTVIIGSILSSIDFDFVGPASGVNMWFFHLQFVFLMAIIGPLAAYGVGGRVSHYEFFLSPYGRGHIALVGLFFFSVLGSLDIGAKTSSVAFKFSTESGVCEVVLLFPVYGGNLFFDRVSQSFIIMEGLSHAIFLENELLNIAPSCLDANARSSTQSLLQGSIATKVTKG